ncbi:MAG TPA: hypothetical protein VK811_08555 [Candidatus Acidoferrum sp.]|nr:hypothetical protein [Candidatus Acidoferrum sp.]
MPAFTKDILAEFSDDTLTLMEEGSAPVVIPYREHPEIFGHPRFLMADFDNSAALVRKTLANLRGARFALIAPRIIVNINRQLNGGIMEIDKSIIQQIFTEAGARKVEIRNA